MRRSGRAGLIRRRLRHAYAPTRRCATGPSKRRSGVHAVAAAALRGRALLPVAHADLDVAREAVDVPGACIDLLTFSSCCTWHRGPGLMSVGVRVATAAVRYGRPVEELHEVAVGMRHWGSNGLIGVTPRPLIDGTTGRLRYARSADFGHEPHRRLGIIPPPRQLACGHRNLAQTCSQTDAVVAPGAKTPPHAAHHSAAIPAAVMCAPRGV